MKKRKLALHTETLRRLDPTALSRAAGGLARPGSAETKCFDCPLYTLPVEECPVLSNILRCPTKAY